MPIVGKLIKTALELNQQFHSLPENARETQAEQLRSLLNTARETAFGKFHGFSTLLEAEELIEAYQAAVPIVEYEQMHQPWWDRQQQLTDITWPGQPQYFALSSGTTGKASKRIPVTKDMLACFRRVGQSQIAALANFDLPADLFEKDVLMLSSSADLTRHRQHLEGEISGINSLHIPDWFDRFYKPGKEIAQIGDWDERIAAIVEAAPDWDVVAIAGIPSWVKVMLERIIEHHQLSNIHELWPHLSIYATGGVAFEPHRQHLERLLDHPITIMDTYLASEGFFAFTARPGTLAMQLAVEHGIFYEFIPFDERGFDETGQLKEDPLALPLDQVEEDQEYALLVSTPAGAWRYMIGDTVKFTDLSRYELVITGRTKYFLNVVGSQLSEEKLNAAIEQLNEEFEAEISEFAVAAVRQGEDDYIHQWILGTKTDTEAATLAHHLDETLQELNKNYRSARNKALREVVVEKVAPEALYDWLEKRKKKGGQIKFPKVMKEKTMRALLDFLKA
ncbi:MAG: GH3 auxin-responsive promoter family protein [Lewinella sp.]|nr:GH3 auxin-responsive promoter family protein [Lewinella sp.]